MNSILLNIQKKELKDIIIKYFDTNTEFSLDNTGHSLTIRHNVGYTFKIGSGIMESYNFTAHPRFSDNSMYEEYSSLGNLKSYKQLREGFEEWVKLVKCELEYESIWDNDYGSYKISNAIEGKFTSEEQNKIRLKIANYKHELSQRDDLKDRLDQINIKLDVLGELVRDLSKVSWRDLIIGSMMSLVGSQVLKSDEAQEIASKLLSILSDTYSHIIDVALN